MAAILTFLSLIDPSDRGGNISQYEYNFRTDDDIKPIGKFSYTNEAPLTYLLSQMPKGEKTFVFAITSKEVKDNKKVILDKRTTYEYYENFIEEKYSELNGGNIEAENKPEIVCVPYDYSEVDKDASLKPEDYAKNIFLKIKEKLDEYKIKPRFYIDFTGGLRDVSYYLASIIRYLQVEGIECERIIYSDYYASPKEVKDIGHIYNLNKVTDSVNDFIKTGSVSELIDIYGEKDYPDIYNLLIALRKFIHTVSIGDVESLDNSVEEVSDNIESISKRIKDNSCKSGEDLYSAIFISLLPKIKESLYITDDNNSFGYIEAIKWCLSHRFIQQAVTIFIEKVPIIIWNEETEEVKEKNYRVKSKGLCRLKSKTEAENLIKWGEKTVAESSDEIHWFYTDFYGAFELKFFMKIKKALGGEYGIEKLKDSAGAPYFSDAEKKAINEIYGDIDAVREKLKKRGVVHREVRTECTDRKLPNDFIDRIPEGDKDSKINECIKRLFTETDNDYVIKAESYFNCKLNRNSRSLTNEEKQLENTRKKIESIANIEEIYKKEKYGEINSFLLILRCYLVVKMIRNLMNHAGGMDEKNKELLIELIKSTKDGKAINLICETNDDGNSIEDEEKTANIYSYSNVKALLNLAVEAVEKTEPLNDSQINGLAEVIKSVKA